MATRQRLREIFYAPATGPAEIIMAVTMFAYGLPLLFYFREEFGRHTTYALLAELFSISPATLGMIFISFSFWRIYEACGASYRRRIITTAGAMFIWMVLFLSFVIGKPNSPGVPVFAGWVVLELWTLFRIRRTT